MQCLRNNSFLLLYFVIVKDYTIELDPAQCMLYNSDNNETNLTFTATTCVSRGNSQLIRGYVGRPILEANRYTITLSKEKERRV